MVEIIEEETVEAVVGAEMGVVVHAVVAGAAAVAVVEVEVVAVGSAEVSITVLQHRNKTTSHLARIGNFNILWNEYVGVL